MFVYIYKYIYKYMCVFIYIHIYTHTYVFIYIYTTGYLNKRHVGCIPQVNWCIMYYSLHLISRIDLEHFSFFVSLMWHRFCETKEGELWRHNSIQVRLEVKPPSEHQHGGNSAVSPFSSI